MAKAGKTGVTSNTPKNILLGAGTIHKNLKYVEGTGWNFAETIMGATKDGSTVSIVPEFYEVEPDGALVSVKELTEKMGETATLKINFLELTKDIWQNAVLGELGTSADANYDKIVSKAHVEKGDYLDNIAFVGLTMKGENVIVILNNALCVSGLEFDGKNKDANTASLEFKCHADIDSDLDTLPYEIYYPKANA